MSALTTDTSPTLSQILRAAADLASRRIRVAIPAVVVSFDADRATCAAQPLIAEPGANGGHSADPALAAVPVLYPGSATARVRFPLAKGDTVLLVFCDRAIDGWMGSLQNAEAVSPRRQLPAELRHHEYTDAVAIPLATSAPADRPVATDRLAVEYEGRPVHVLESEVRLGDEGAAQQTIRGTAYRSAEATANGIVQTQVAAAGAALVAQAIDPVFVVLCPLAAALSNTAGVALNAAAAALGSFEAQAATFLAPEVRVP